LFPPLREAPEFDRKSKLGRATAKALARKSALTRRALADLDLWIAGETPAVAAE
jgi:methylenetetrahydrofolate--tRNA-(uracil-5-)-methyltransferase